MKNTAGKSATPTPHLLSAKLPEQPGIILPLGKAQEIDWRRHFHLPKSKLPFSPKSILKIKTESVSQIKMQAKGGKLPRQSGLSLSNKNVNWLCPSFPLFPCGSLQVVAFWRIDLDTTLKMFPPKFTDILVSFILIFFVQRISKSLSDPVAALLRDSCSKGLIMELHIQPPSDFQRMSPMQDKKCTFITTPMRAPPQSNMYAADKRGDTFQFPWPWSQHPPISWWGRQIGMFVGGFLVRSCHHSDQISDRSEVSGLYYSIRGR